MEHAAPVHQINLPVPQRLAHYQREHLFILGLSLGAIKEHRCGGYVPRPAGSRAISLSVPGTSFFPNSFTSKESHA